jgi:hypothetical protein
MRVVAGGSDVGGEQRFREPLQVLEGLRSDVVRRRVAGEVPLLQEVDIASSAEITLDARVRQLSVHGKNRCVLFHRSVASTDGIRAVCRAPQGQFQGQFWGQRGSRNSKPRVYLGFSSR